MFFAASLTGRKSEHRPTAATSFHSMITRAMASMKKQILVNGIGINDVDQYTQKTKNVDGKYVVVWRCPFYSVWTSMLSRCYSNRYQSRQPSYKDCFVCDEWKLFSNFKSWMQQQDWKGKQLDKDLLIPNNRVYSPEACIFVSQSVNNFVEDSAASRGEFLIGASWHKTRNKFRSYCRNPFTSKTEHLGLFTEELEAHLAWKKRKHELACQLADTCDNPRLAEALRQRYV